MKTNELRNKTIAELQVELIALLKEQFNLRIQKGVSQQVAQSHLFKKVRRSISRIKTILAEKKGSTS